MRRLVGGMVVALAIAAARSSMACSVAQVAGSDAVIPADAINQRLLSAAILAEVNNQRCHSGLRRVVSSAGLADVAARHSGWMAASGQLTHDSTLAGISSLRDRLVASGHPGRGGTENIGQVQRYPVDLVPSFRITDPATCQFATTDGAPIPAHSYRTLAQSIVALWMKSPDHKANILNRKVKSLGSGAAFDAGADWCGQFYITQTFSN